MEAMILTIREGLQHLSLCLARNRWAAFSWFPTCGYNKDSYMIFLIYLMSFLNVPSFEMDCSGRLEWDICIYSGDAWFPVWLLHHYSKFVMGRTAAWYRSQGTALEPGHKKHTSYKSMLMRFHVHETDRINLACVFVGAHVHIKRNKPEEAKTINQYQHFMVWNTVYHFDNKGSKGLNSAV